jgi:hypothetical protein
VSKALEILKVVHGWGRRNKKLLAKVTAFISAGLIGIGQTDAGYAMGLLTAWLDGAGRAASDREVKAR